MDVLAALGDASTAVIAIVAILLGVVFAVRGQRGERSAVAGAGAAGDSAPTLLKLPVATAAPEPDTDADGLRTMAVGEVGHGAIRLGRPEGQAEPAPAVPAEPAAVEPPDEPPAPASQAPPAPGRAPFHQGPIKLREPSDD
jgi:hypothetical protein